MFEYDQEIVQSLLRDNGDFKRLYDKHGMLEQELEEAYKKTDRVDDTTLGKLKKKKLHIKDKMASYVESYRQSRST
jgi:uncharacterized protein YdcH (DUF465 family)